MGRRCSASGIRRPRERSCKSRPEARGSGRMCTATLRLKALAEASLPANHGFATLPGAAAALPGVIAGYPGTVAPLPTGIARLPTAVAGLAGTTAGLPVTGAALPGKAARLAATVARHAGMIARDPAGLAENRTTVARVPGIGALEVVADSQIAANPAAETANGGCRNSPTRQKKRTAHNWRRSVRF